MITISVILFTVLAALLFLSKVKADNLGALYKWTGLVVLIAALSMLAFQSYRSCSKLWHRQTCGGAQCESKFHKRNKAGMHWNQHNRMGRNDNCCMMNGNDFHFFSGEKGDSLEMRMKKKMRLKDDDGKVFRESTVDTVDGKIIIKETEIIKK